MKLSSSHSSNYLIHVLVLSEIKSELVNVMDVEVGKILTYLNVALNHVVHRIPSSFIAFDGRKICVLTNLCEAHRKEEFWQNFLDDFDYFRVLIYSYFTARLYRWLAKPTNPHLGRLFRALLVAQLSVITASRFSTDFPKRPSTYDRSWKCSLAEWSFSFSSGKRPASL